MCIAASDLYYNLFYNANEVRLNFDTLMKMLSCSVARHFKGILTGFVALLWSFFTMSRGSVSSIGNPPAADSNNTEALDLHEDTEALDLHEDNGGDVGEHDGFIRKLHRRIFEDKNFVADAGPGQLYWKELQSLDGVDFLDATVGPLLLMGLRQVGKLRPRKPRQWLAFYLLSRKPLNEDDTTDETKIKRPVRLSK